MEQKSANEKSVESKLMDQVKGVVRPSSQKSGQANRPSGLENLNGVRDGKTNFAEEQNQNKNWRNEK